ncbi:hypothetical protein Moror_14321 [Moniliophthora roreri MCA 2997]|uniref:Uncharacterized protein n=1 Tax=Moniliophthora roreri (strain MCA 2997) TaxID=1381753 RepID=V2XQ90_MONRO|nr:hypothetical protein Moror_14321 [Moniliophthora roreri MCA 2997]
MNLRKSLIRTASHLHLAPAPVWHVALHTGTPSFLSAYTGPTSTIASQKAFAKGETRRDGQEIEYTKETTIRHVETVRIEEGESTGSVKPSGPWSRADTSTDEYCHVSRMEPYKLPGETLRYGGREEWLKEKGPQTSKPGDGLCGKAKHGMKPENEEERDPLGDKREQN